MKSDSLALTYSKTPHSRQMTEDEEFSSRYLLFVSVFMTVFICSQNNEIVLEIQEREVSFPPAYTIGHLLNQLIHKMFGRERSHNVHIERKKSETTFVLDRKPGKRDKKKIETRMNELIQQDMPVTFEVVDRQHLLEGISLSHLPADASDAIHICRIGGYDACPCIGKHMHSASQMGRFELLGTNWDERRKTFRVRFRIIPQDYFLIATRFF